MVLNKHGGWTISLKLINVWSRICTHVVKVFFQIKWSNVDSTKIPWIKSVSLNIIELLTKENTVYLKPKSSRQSRDLYFWILARQSRRGRNLFFQLLTRQSRQSRDLCFQLFTRQSRQSRYLFFNY